MPFPTSEHQAIYELIDTRTNQLSAQIEQLRSTLMAEADALRTAIDNIETSIANEIQQLADAVNSSTELAELKAAVNASVGRLTTLDDSLKADDAPVPPTP
jgi:uncharacterized protein involved in exopolysaccharide biosynthesis